MESPRLELILDHVSSHPPPGAMTTTIIAIDGPGGAGKSTLARRLAPALETARILCTDDFASWDNPVEWWPRLLAQVLEPLSVNEPAHYQRYDWVSETLAEWHDIEPGGVLLFEGVTASRTLFRPYLACSIWVETPREERLRRGLERDGMGARAMWNDWMANEDAYVERERPHEHADLVVSGRTPL